MRGIWKIALAVVATAGLACSGGGGDDKSTPLPAPPAAREGAATFGASGRMTGGTLAADVRLGAPFGEQKAQGGTITMTEPVLTR